MYKNKEKQKEACRKEKQKEACRQAMQRKRKGITGIVDGQYVIPKQADPVIPPDVILEKIEFVIPEKAPLVWNTLPDVVERLAETGAVAYDEQGRPHARLPRT